MSWFVLQTEDDNYDQIDQNYNIYIPQPSSISFVNIASDFSINYTTFLLDSKIYCLRPNAQIWYFDILNFCPVIYIYLKTLQSVHVHTAFKISWRSSGSLDSLRSCIIVILNGYIETGDYMMDLTDTIFH